MSDSEEEHFCYYGIPLDPYDEDCIPKKRPITVEEQIATDAQGRRRFHGAFTGGFSAGFFNTVGSLEGWLPNEFKSSRSEKAKNYIQKPEDFMDEEDMGEYGIAPQVIKATDEYNTSKKRKKQVFSDGPIPGEPVLHHLITSGNETIGYMLLKNLGVKDKIRRRQEELQSETKVYGCQMPNRAYDISEDINHDKYEVPEIYKEFLSNPKSNTFGLGYKGLNKNTFSLFPEPGSSKLNVIDKSNKKVSISGQAFGVGAFEEEDDDIYMKDDMNKYDFEISEEKKQAESVKKSNLVFDMFIPSKTPLLNKKLFPPPKIPHSFTGEHKVRKSRFEPLPEEPVETGKINAAVRAKYLGEETDKEYTESVSPLNPQKGVKKQQETKLTKVAETKNETETRNAFDITSIYLSDKFVSSSKNEDMGNILQPLEKMGTIHGTDQMRDAARMKMFGPLTRVTSDWIPCSMLCKKFNVPEPFVDRPTKQRTRTKNLIFEYEKHAEEQTELKPGLSHQKEESVIKEELETSIVINDEESKPEEVKESNEIHDVSIDLTEKLNLDQKQDLFKAIFLSSDESEDETEEKPEEENISKESRSEELKSTVLSDNLLPKIKPMKEGILSGVNFHAFRKPTVNPKMEEPANNETVVENETNTTDLNLYGPKIPQKLPANQPGSNNTVFVTSYSDDEWVEKDESKKKKHKKHKKDKHKKHKRDKHKSSR